MMTYRATQNFTDLQYTDTEIIAGLKNNDKDIIGTFFYGYCSYMLNDLRQTMLNGWYDYDDMVSELYLYLSEDGWRRLDSFSGKNGCSLKSWMVKVSWNYFNRRRQQLMGNDIVYKDLSDIHNLTGNVDEHSATNIRVDVQSTLNAMPNRQYAEVINLMLIEGYDAEDVAVMYNTTKSNVYNIKHRAILQFCRGYCQDNLMAAVS